MYATTAVQTGFKFIKNFFGQVMKELYGNIFNKPTVS
jgi:hypothetical protein